MLALPLRPAGIPVGEEGGGDALEEAKVEVEVEIRKAERDQRAGESPPLILAATALVCRRISLQTAEQGF